MVTHELSSSTHAPSISHQDDRAIAFGRYRLFPQLRLLLHEGNKVELGGRAFDVLHVLLDARGQVVTKDELILKVWSGAVVEENNLQAQMSAIRRALGADRDLISTEFGRGYRLTVTPEETDGVAPIDNHAPLPVALPAPVTSLLGRGTEIREILDTFNKSRFITITGPGGIGKTRLAIELGRLLHSEFPGEILFADMAKVGASDLVWPTIASTLRLPAMAVHNGEHIWAAWGERRTLLIIDNCEHLADSIAAAVENLLRNGPKLHVLATSQEPLRTEGEYVYRLSTLSVPSEKTLSAKAALAYSAVQLFVERVAASSHQFDFNDSITRDVIAICQQLDGMPLALELAAARAPSLGIPGVLNGLTDRFRFLNSGRRTALPRHRTLRATVDWSHRLLSEEECRLFRRLSVFVSAFTGEAAHAVTAPNKGELWDTIDLLDSLVAKSLLYAELNYNPPRYRYLETIRVYARERLAHCDEVISMTQRHAEFFAPVTRKASIDWKQLATGNWCKLYSQNIDDVKAALDWAFSDDGDWYLGINMLADSAPFWVQFSQHDECQKRINFALYGGDRSLTIAPRQEMLLQAALGTSLTWAKGPVDETRAAWMRALDLSSQLRDNEIQLQAHYGLWLYNLRIGKYSASLSHATRTMALAHHIEDPEAFATGQRIAGVSYHFLGEHAQARDLIETALKWYDSKHPVQAFRFGLDQRVASLAFLARILWIQGFSSAAMETAAASVDAARTLDHTCSLCCAFAEGWCMVHALNGNGVIVEEAAAFLFRQATEDGLGFWKTYADIFRLWALIQRDNSDLTHCNIKRVIVSIKESSFNPGYSPILESILLHPVISAHIKEFN